ncbi:MAG: hypothetical protein ACK55I_23430, partial [bacterium]
LCESLKQLSKVEELAACSIFNDPGEIAVNYFFTTLCKLKTIRCLDLSKNKLENSQLNYLFTQLVSLQNLHTLVIS